jgi:hypothetical protein
MGYADQCKQVEDDNRNRKLVKELTEENAILEQELHKMSEKLGYSQRRIMTLEHEKSLLTDNPLRLILKRVFGHKE